MQNEAILLENYAHFVARRRELLSDPATAHKFAVVHNLCVHKCFETFEQAHLWAKSQFTDDNFIIQQVIDETAVTDFVYECICR